MWTLQELLSHTAQAGKLVWLGTRPERRAPMNALGRGTLLKGRGLEGDRSALKLGRSRQVTLLQAEHLVVIAHFLGVEEVPPEHMRRNLVVSGFNLLSVRRGKFRIGSTLLEGTGHCHPCSRLEETLGHGGYNATRGHGGITARIVEGGPIAVGDEVALVSGAAEGGA